ncbi:hypothetical protein VNO78_32120 [Psophocarpus tetragonolobus]|uniref:Uncharacterized protein n=1 Tax=Psophocarpus tetragonolobus TaxID=3891 RepID=A0AAN9X8F4_PSOTE
MAKVSLGKRWFGIGKRWVCVGKKGVIRWLFVGLNSSEIKWGKGRHVAGLGVGNVGSLGKGVTCLTPECT